MDAQKEVEQIDEQIKELQERRTKLLTPKSSINPLVLKYAKATGMAIGSFEISRNIDENTGRVVCSASIPLSAIDPGGYGSVGLVSIIDGRVIDRFHIERLQERIDWEKQWSLGDYTMKIPTY